MNKRNNGIPYPVLQRLTKYLVHAQKLRQEGLQWVSSDALARTLGLTRSTVRQDMSHIHLRGRARGYQTAFLARILRRILGGHRTTYVVIVGAGNLGRALALHTEFERRNFRICALFDSNPRLVGKKIGRLLIRNVRDLPRIAKIHNVEIGMIAVPFSSAQEVTDRLVLAGIKGILNLSPGHVHVPPHVSVVDARIVASLQGLLYVMRYAAKRRSSQGT